MKTVTVPIRSLREHPAQMRTEMKPGEMAKLVLQVYERGLSPHQPIIVADNGDGTYRVVSGHRRWLAALLAAEVKARADGKNDDVDLDFVRQVIFEFAARPGEVGVCPFCQELLEEFRGEKGWCASCRGWVEAQVEQRDLPSPVALLEAYGPLMERYGDLEVPVVLFEGDEKAEILALQAANFGHETPDLLGQARSYTAALQAGATVAEIAANTGQAVSRVEAVVSLTRVPEDLAQAVAAGEFALGVAAAVARLRNEAQREGVTRCILERGRCTVEQAGEIASALRKWKPPTVSLDPEVTPHDRNEARVIAALWARLRREDAVSAWYTAARTIGDRKSSLYAWMRWLGIEGNRRDLLYELVPEARCENCQLRDLLREAPPFSYPHYPCQEEKEAKPCFNGVFGQDPFYLQVPFGWEEYPGVQRGLHGSPVCLSPEDFRHALEAAAERDEATDPGQEDDFTGSYGYAYSPPGTKVENIAEQRALIRSYMEHHDGMSGGRHPVATRCDDCRYHLEHSPTKDPTVPPCQWAARRHRVEFLVRAPVEGEGPEIPLCRQFAPTRSWNDVIPEHPVPPGVPRVWMVAVMREMTKEVERYKAAASDSRLVCEYLTGRPLKAAESHKGWFVEGLEREIGNLSDGQLWTLFMWVTADWMWNREFRYLLPLPDGRVLLYAERAWQPPAGDEEGRAEEG